MAFKKSISVSDPSFTESPRVSSLRRSIQLRARTSLVPQYSIGLNSDDVPSEEDVFVSSTKQCDALEIILKKPLSHICRVSPLNNLKYDKAKLKQYALKLKQFVSGNVTNSTNVKYNAEVNVVENLKLEKKHADALQITIWGSSAESKEDFRLVYQGLMFSWGYFAAQLEKNITHLPLLLDSGHMKIITSVRQTLQKLFDCVITPLSFTQSDLLLFSALMSSFSPLHGGKPVTFEYNIAQLTTPTKIEISVEIDDIHELWRSCFTEDDEPTIHDEQSSGRLYRLFQEHIKMHFDVDVAYFELIKMTYPSLILQSRGMIKLKDLEASKVVLRILCEMSAILKGSIPKLAADYD